VLLWITGKGLLGSALVHECNGSLPVLHTGREVDVADREKVFPFAEQHPGITHIVNCAAFSEVDKAELMKEEAYRANAEGPKNLAQLACQMGAKLIHISTDYVFPGTSRRLLTEQDRVNPCNYYGWTKLRGEENVLAHSMCVIRTSWLFGAKGKNFVSKLLKLLLSQKEVRLTDDQWGRFTYAPDLAKAILKMLHHTGLYQYANAGVATRYEFGLAMREEAFFMGYPILTEAVIPVPGAAFPTPCPRPEYSAFDTEKIEPYVKIRHWREALRDFLCAQLPVYL